MTKLNTNAVTNIAQPTDFKGTFVRVVQKLVLEICATGKLALTQKEIPLTFLKDYLDLNKGQKFEIFTQKESLMQIHAFKIHIFNQLFFLQESNV